VERVCPRMYIASDDIDFCPHKPEQVDMQVHRPGTDCATARQ